MKEIKKGGEKEESNATEGELPEGLTEKKINLVYRDTNKFFTMSQLFWTQWIKMVTLSKHCWE